MESKLLPVIGRPGSALDRGDHINTLPGPSELGDISMSSSLPPNGQEGQEDDGEQPPLDINHALQYLDAVKTQFEQRPMVRPHVKCLLYWV